MESKKQEMKRAKQKTGALRAARLEAIGFAKLGKQLPQGFQLLYTATVLRKGWEMDNHLWIIRDKNGPFIGTTSHGNPCIADRETIDIAVDEHAEAHDSLLRARQCLSDACKDG